MSLAINDGFVAVFDYSVYFNLHTKVATIHDASTYTNTTGVSITVTIVSSLGTSSSTTFAANGGGTQNLPTLNNIVAPGTYTVRGVLTDSVSGYTLTKTQIICTPTQCDTVTANGDGCLVPTVTFKCADDKLIYADATDYTYQGISAQTDGVIAYSVTATDPNGTVIANAANTNTFVKTGLINGRYQFVIANYATYDFGDNLFVTIFYGATKQYICACDINFCEVYCAIDSLRQQWLLVKGTGSSQEAALKYKLDQLPLLIDLAQIGIECGYDVSAKVAEIETLSGASCACGCGTSQVNLPACSCDHITITSSDNSIHVEQTTIADTVNFDLTVSLSVCLSSTLFVSTCGDDATGEIGNILKPFASIKGAVAAASTSQCIYVFAGTYSETLINAGSDAVEKRGLLYYFSPGVTVNAVANPVFSTTTDTGNITVRGAGILKSSVSVIVSNTVTMVYDIECTSIQSTGLLATDNAIAFQNGTFTLACDSVTALGNSCFDVRTGLTTGYVTCNLIDNSTSAAAAPAVHFKNITTSGTVWTFNVKQTKTNANTSFAGVALDTGNTGVPKVYYNGNVQNIQASSGGYGAGVGISSAGYLIYSGDIDCVSGIGANCIAGDLVLKGCRIRTAGQFAALSTQSPPDTGTVFAENCMFVNSASSTATIFGDTTGFFQINNCLVKNEATTGLAPCVQLGSDFSMINNTMLRTDSTGVGVSVYNSGAAHNTQYKNVTANRTTSGAFTNLIDAVSVNTNLNFYIY